MKLLILLLFAATATHAWRELFHPPFLEGLSWTARDEYYKILFNKSLTIAEQKEQIIAWAKKYNIQGPVQTFFDKKAKYTEEMMQNFTALVNELPNAVANLTKIMENKNQTFLGMMKAVHELKAENPAVYSVLKFAMEESMHEHGPHGDHPFGPPPPPFPPHDRPRPWHGPWGRQPWERNWGQPWERNWNDGPSGGWPIEGQNGGPPGGWPRGGQSGGPPVGWPNGGQNGGPPGGWPMGGEEGDFGPFDPWQNGFNPNGPEEFGPGQGF